MEIVNNQLFKTITSSQIESCSTLLLSKPAFPLKVEVVINQSFQETPHPPKWKLSQVRPYKTINFSQIWNYLKLVHLRLPHPSQVKTVQISPYNLHILWKCKLLKISPFRTTKPFQSGYCNESVVFMTITSSQSENCLKSILSRLHILPMWKLFKIIPF